MLQLPIRENTSTKASGSDAIEHNKSLEHSRREFGPIDPLPMQIGVVPSDAGRVLNSMLGCSTDVLAISHIVRSHFLDSTIFL